jgi:dTDP-4-dehydrorhamnose 3,5-epimerase-like enzyme
LASAADARGGLVAIEVERDLPFPVRRVYYLHSFSDGAERGFHAHKDLQQLAICVSGSCKITLDDGKHRQEAILQRPNEGLLITSLVWREIRPASPDCVLLVLASQAYDEADYIRSYKEFLSLANNVGESR